MRPGAWAEMSELLQQVRARREAQKQQQEEQLQRADEQLKQQEAYTEIQQKSQEYFELGPTTAYNQSLQASQHASSSSSTASSTLAGPDARNLLSCSSMAINIADVEEIEIDMSKQKLYASATRVKHDNAVASVVRNISSERANCLSFTIPKGTKVSIPDVAQALEKLGDGVECFVPLIEDATIILQVVEVSENSKKLVQKMIEDGLPLKGITAVIAKLPQAVAGGDRVAGRVQNFTPTIMGIAALKAGLEKFGDLINLRLNHYAGTRIYDRTVDFLINISQSHKLPPSVFRIDNETWAEDVKIIIVTRTMFCYFCRSTEHVRKACTEAPACYHCGDCDHAPSRCRNRNKPSESIYKSLSDWGTDDMPVDDCMCLSIQRRGSCSSRT